jgi:hypothetical protein
MVPESNDEGTSPITSRNTVSDAFEELPNNLFNNIRAPEESICQEGYTQESVGILLTQPNNMDINDQTTRKRQKKSQIVSYKSMMDQCSILAASSQSSTETSQAIYAALLELIRIARGQGLLVSSSSQSRVTPVLENSNLAARQPINSQVENANRAAGQSRNIQDATVIHQSQSQELRQELVHPIQNNYLPRLWSDKVSLLLILVHHNSQDVLSVFHYHTTFQVAVPKNYRDNRLEEMKQCSSDLSTLTH